MDGIVVIDLGFGDSGKGTMTDFLVHERETNWVIRYNGGAQCGHNVKNGEFKHCFSQFGSGSQRPNVKTYLSRHVLFNPISLIEEATILQEKGVSKPLDKIWIDPDTPIITPFHVWANRAKEMHRGKNRHGSCGKGIGELGSDLVNSSGSVIRAWELNYCEDKLHRIQEHRLQECRSMGVDVTPYQRFSDSKEPANLAKNYSKIASALQIAKPTIDGSVIFEGAQGVLLDEWYGFHPYTTWSTIIPTNVADVINESIPSLYGNVEIMGVVRSYMTRHGAGPLVTETKPENIFHPHEVNCSNKWQQHFRFGWPDLVLWKYAVMAANYEAPFHYLAVTHLDIFQHQALQICGGYKQKDTGEQYGILLPGEEPDLETQAQLTKDLMNNVEPIYIHDIFDENDMCFALEQGLNIPVKYKSYGPDFGDKVILDISL